MQYSIYYQAHVQKELSWMVTAAIRYLDHVAFDRTVDVQASVFEFFIAPDFEDEFVRIAQRLQDRGVFLHFEKLPNRLIDQNYI